MANRSTEPRPRDPALTRAADFVWRNGRLLDRHRFAHLFLDGPADAVVAALRPYQNPDGGFGHALEPDLRGAAAQPVPAEHALQVLDELDRFDDPMVPAVCAWLERVSTDEGGVPFVLPSVADGPHAPWWVPTGAASLNPTAGIAGLLHKHGVAHPWLDRATAYCWRALPAGRAALGPDDAVAVLAFLEHVPDRGAAEAEFPPLGRRILDELVALDPAAPGYVKSPLEFAPRPEALARRLFDDATIERHLDALAARQGEDGGWPISWEPPGPGAVYEWRAFVTIQSLSVLRSYGRGPGSPRGGEP
jgi:hypothetical protein